MWLGCNNRSITNPSSGPPPSSVTLTHGQTATVSGTTIGANTGFLVWDHGQDGAGNSNALWAFKRPTSITPSTYNLQNVASPSTDVNLTTISSPYPRIANFLRGSCYSDVAGNASRVVQISRQIVGRPAWPYFSNWQYKWRVDPLWQFGVPNGANTPPPDDNMKMFVYTEGNGGPFGDGTTQPFMYWGMNNQIGGPTNNTSVTNSGEWIQQTFPGGTSQWADPDLNNHNGFWGNIPNPSNPSNGWIDVKIIAKWTPNNDGYFRVYYNDSLSINYLGPTVFGTSATTVNECIGMPYTRDYGLNGGSPPPTPNNAVYLADILYFNGASNGRLVMTNSPVYSSATKVWQIPGSADGAGNYTFTVNGGPFPANSQVYLFEVDDSTGTNNAIQPATTFKIVDPFDLFIATNGNDANPGTLAQPWAMTSLINTNANNSKMAGKRIGLIAGTYNQATAQLTSGSNPGNDGTTNNYQWPVFDLPQGTATNPTYIASCDTGGNYAPRVSAIIGTGATAVGANLSVNSMIGQGPNKVGFYTVDAIELNGNSSGYVGQSNLLGAIVNIGGPVSNVIFQNCNIHGMGASSTGQNEAGIFVGAGTGVIIQNCWFHDIHKPNQTDHCHAIEEYGGRGNIYRFNTITNCDTAIESKSNNTRTQVYGNYVYGMSPATSGGANAVFEGFDGGGPISPADPTAPYFIHHNVVDSCNENFHAIDFGNGTQPLQVWNNTCYDIRSGGITTYDVRLTGSGLLTFYNNINVTVNSSGSGAGKTALNTGNAGVVDYNGYYLNTLTAGWGLDESTTYNTLAAWRTALGGSFESHSVAFTTAAGAAVKFVGAGNNGIITPGNGPNQFQLQSSSPSFNTGSTTGTTGGTAQNMGAWDGTYSTIGCDWLTYPVATP